MDVSFGISLPCLGVKAERNGGDGGIAATMQPPQDSARASPVIPGKAQTEAGLLLPLQFIPRALVLGSWRLPLKSKAISMSWCSALGSTTGSKITVTV